MTDHEPDDADIVDGRIVCSTCGEPVHVEWSIDLDSAWLVHGDLRAWPSTYAPGAGRS